MGIAADRKAMVVGAASGFGLGVARRLADELGRVAVCDVAADRLGSVCEADSRLLPIPLDVTRAADVAPAVERARELLGGLDTVVYTAGVIHVKPVEEVAEREWDHTLAVNLKGAFLLFQAAVPSLKASGRGRIVAIASDCGKRGFPWIQAYTASKFGLIGLCESLAAELAPAQVTVNAVCPAGCPTTEMGRALTEWKRERTGLGEREVLANMAKWFPMGRYVSEQDIVGACLYFLTEEAGFVTAVSLDVDGGAYLGGPFPGSQ